MFLMKRIGKYEVALTIDYDLIKAYNIMHVKYGMQLEWGIVAWKRNGDDISKGLIPQN